MISSRRIRCLFLLLAFSSLGAASPYACFQPVQRLDVPGGTSRLGYNFQKSIAMLPDGSVHAVWSSDLGDGPQVFYRRSPDRGSNWAPPVPLSEPNAESGFPSIAASDGRVHVAWHESIGAGLFIVARVSDDGGQSFSEGRLVSSTGQSSTVSLAARGNRVHAVFVETEAGFAEVYAAASLDGGQTWSDAMRISPPLSESWVPTVAVDGDIVAVAWVDYRDGNEEEYLRVSRDSGSSWEPVIRVTENPADSWAPSVIVSGESIWMAFFDRRTAGLLDPEVEGVIDLAGAVLGLDFPSSPPRDPLHYYLHDFQTRIEAKRAAVEAAVPGYIAAGGDPTPVIEFVAEFDRRHEAWSKGWGIFLVRSDDLGATWSPPRLIATPGGPALRPAIALDGDALHLTWFDGRSGNLEVFYRLSNDLGESFGPEQRLTSSEGSSLRPSIDVLDGHIQVLWFEEAVDSEESAILHRRGRAG